MREKQNMWIQRGWDVRRAKGSRAGITQWGPNAEFSESVDLTGGCDAPFCNYSTRWQRGNPQSDLASQLAILTSQLRELVSWKRVESNWKRLNISLLIHTHAFIHATQCTHDTYAHMCINTWHNAYTHVHRYTHDMHAWACTRDKHVYIHAAHSHTCIYNTTHEQTCLYTHAHTYAYAYIHTYNDTYTTYTHIHDRHTHDRHTTNTHTTDIHTRYTHNRNTPIWQTHTHHINTHTHQTHIDKCWWEGMVVYAYDSNA